MTAYILNLFDLAFTLYALSHGAYELNPLMRNVPFQIFYKVVVVGFAIWWLRKRNVNLWFAVALFAAVDIYHLYFIIGGVFL